MFDVAPTVRMHDLLELRLVIFHMILEEIESAKLVDSIFTEWITQVTPTWTGALLTILFVWRKSRDECNPLLFRSINLFDYIDPGRIDRFVERILDTEDSIAGHARHLAIGLFGIENFCPCRI